MFHVLRPWVSTCYQPLTECLEPVVHISYPELLNGYAWWRHQMETFPALLALCAGNSPVTGEFPAQRAVTWSFDVSFDRTWINGWVINGEAGDLRRHRTHYDVTVMVSPIILHRSFSMGYNNQPLPTLPWWISLNIIQIRTYKSWFNLIVYPCPKPHAFNL